VKLDSVVITKKELDNAAVAFSNKKLKEKVLKTVIKENDPLKLTEKKSPEKKM
jgi:hypothetical protein